MENGNVYIWCNEYVVMGTTHNTKKESPTIMLDREKKILKCWVRSAGNSGRIIVPKEWIGKIAKVQIIEEDEDLEAKNKKEK